MSKKTINPDIDIDIEMMEEILDSLEAMYNDAKQKKKSTLKTKKHRIRPKHKDYLQLKISLNDIKPPIWRRVVVDPTLSLEDMNIVIWDIMPWDGSHMHCFSNKTIRATVPYEEDPFSDDTDDYEDLTIGDFFLAEGDKCKYEYDFGDGWEHTILLEKFVTPLKETRAKFIKGRCMAPPDDCGGPWGYEHLKEVMQDPKNPNYEEMREWCGLEKDEIFDPKDMGFTTEDIAEINEMFEGI